MSVTQTQAVEVRLKNPLKRPIMNVLGSIMLVLLAAAIVTGLNSDWSEASDIVATALNVALGVYLIIVAVVTRDYFGDGRRGLIFMGGTLVLVLAVVRVFNTP